MKFQIKFKWFQGLAVSFLFLASLPSAAIEGGSDCLKAAIEVSGQATHKSNAPEPILIGSAGTAEMARLAAERQATQPKDFDMFMAASPLVEGGVVAMPVRDQKFAEICWSYALNEFVDALNFQSTGSLKVTSADHNGFWHFYFQVFEHGTYFAKLAEKVSSNKMTIDEAAAEAVQMLHSLSMSGTARAKEFTVDPGNDEPTALKEAKIIGFVPDHLYDTPLNNQAEANALTKALKDLVTSIIQDPSRGNLFGAKDADGINTPLYELMTTKLKTYIGSSSNNHLPYRPNDTFVVDGVTYTPTQYMTQVLKFNPDDFVNVALTKDNFNLVREAVRELISGPQKMPVIMGFVVLNQLIAQKQKVWSAQMLVNQKVQNNGGHAVTIVNEKTSNKNGAPHEQVTVDPNYDPSEDAGDIFENSWAEQGFDINGRTPKTPAQSGFNGITPTYHQISVEIKDPSEFVLPVAFLQQDKYKSLLTDAAAQLAAPKPHPLPPVIHR